MTQNYSDNNIEEANGFDACFTAIISFACMIYFAVGGIMFKPEMLFFSLFLLILTCFIIHGIVSISPNEVVVLKFFGKYFGTVINNGLVFVNPLMSRTNISKKINHFSNHPIKVNDKLGNPLELSCIFAWRVKDAAKALFSVEDYDIFVRNQAECILAQTASLYAYDSEKSEEIYFRRNSDKIALFLKKNLQQRVSECGLEIIDVQFNHFAYSLEISAPMLKKQ